MDTIIHNFDGINSCKNELWPIFVIEIVIMIILECFSAQVSDNFGLTHLSLQIRIAVINGLQRTDSLI
jgi:hypothetical protein